LLSSHDLVLLILFRVLQIMLLFFVHLSPAGTLQPGNYPLESFYQRFQCYSIHTLGRSVARLFSYTNPCTHFSHTLYLSHTQVLVTEGQPEKDGYKTAQELGNQVCVRVYMRAYAHAVLCAVRCVLCVKMSASVMPTFYFSLKNTHMLMLPTKTYTITHTTQIHTSEKHTHILKRMRSRTCTQAYTHTHTQTQTNTHQRTPTHTHTHIHKHLHTHTQTHIQTTNLYSADGVV